MVDSLLKLFDVSVKNDLNIVLARVRGGWRILKISQFLILRQGGGGPKISNFSHILKSLQCPYLIAIAMAIGPSLLFIW